MIASKGAKQLRITEDESEKYASMGYDICEVHDKKLVVVQYGVGKAVPYAQYASLKAELDALKAKLAQKGLDDMTLTELRAYAAQHDIDLGGLTKKEDVLAHVQKTVGDDSADQ